MSFHRSDIGKEHFDTRLDSPQTPSVSTILTILATTAFEFFLLRRRGILSGLCPQNLFQDQPIQTESYKEDIEQGHNKFGAINSSICEDMTS